MTVLGVTNHFLTGFKACFMEGNFTPGTVILMKSHGWGGHRPRVEPVAVILLHGHAVKTDF